jgi:proton-dependent oligopeptide transporter, POT family
MNGTAPTLDQIRDFKGKYPKQLWYLFGTEMWERFCFYGLRGMLTVFMATELLMPEKAANLQYGAIQAFVYAFTFIGGVFADKILGFQKSLFWGAALMILGGFIIAIAPKDYFYFGICFNIIGTGFFKPNISTMVGQLYHEGDNRRDAGFGLFYAGINAGAFLGGMLMVWVGKTYSWRLAFALVGIVMIISLLNFLFRRSSFGPIGLSPLHPDTPVNRRRLYEWATYIGSLLTIPLIYKMVTNTKYTDLFMYIVGPMALAFLFYSMSRFRDDKESGAPGLWHLMLAGAVTITCGFLVLFLLDLDGLRPKLEVVSGAAAFTGVLWLWAVVRSNETQRKLHAALIFIIFSIFFWAFFEQSGGSLSLFALNNLEADFFGLPLDPNSVNNSANSLFVIAFSALLGLLWIWLSKRKVEPNSVVKFGLGFLMLGAAFYIFKSTMAFANADGITSLEVFTLAYFVITFGELCLSPIGLSLMTKLAPIKIQGLMMGMWFLASAYGQYVAGLLGAGMSSENPDATNYEKLELYTDGYGQLGLYALIAGVALIVISPLVRKLMRGVH